MLFRGGRTKSGLALNHQVAVWTLQLSVCVCVCVCINNCHLTQPFVDLISLCVMFKALLYQSRSTKLILILAADLWTKKKTNKTQSASSRDRRCPVDAPMGARALQHRPPDERMPASSSLLWRAKPNAWKIICLLSAGGGACEVSSCRSDDKYVSFAENKLQ